MKYLSQEQIEQFQRDGFLVVRGLIEPEQMRHIATWTDKIAQWPETPLRHMMYFEPGPKDERLLNRIENFCPYHAGLAASVLGAPLAHCVAELFGEAAVLFKDKINYKLPGGDGFSPHQDVQAGWHRYASLHITALVSIDIADEANGCLELAAGHHRRGLIGESWRPLNEEETRDMTFIPCPTAPGDAVFFDSFVPHRSAPNHSTQPRRILYLTYNRASEGDHRAQYYADKRLSYPPDCEREPGKEYRYRV